MKSLLLLLAPVPLLLTPAGCGNGDAGDTSDSEPATFSQIHSEILVPRCGGQGCHSSNLGGNLILTSATSETYDNLVDQPAAGAQCRSSGGTRVVPGNPEDSLLFTKLIDPPCGTPMPLGGEMLPNRQIEMIRNWIERGAPND